MMCAVSLFQLSGAVQLSFHSVPGRRSTTGSDCFSTAHTQPATSTHTHTHTKKVFRSFRAGRKGKKIKGNLYSTSVFSKNSDMGWKRSKFIAICYVCAPTPKKKPPTTAQCRSFLLFAPRQFWLPQVFGNSVVNQKKKKKRERRSS